MYRLIFAFVFIAAVLAVGPALACDPNVNVGFAYGQQVVGVPANVYYAQPAQVVVGANQFYGRPAATFHGHVNSGFAVAVPPQPVVKIKIVNRRF